MLTGEPEHPSRVSRESVQALLEQKKRPMPSARPVLQIAKSPEKYGTSMFFLPGKNDEQIREVNDCLRSDDLRADPESGIYYSGYWPVADGNADLLVKEGGFLWATVVGWGNEAARVLGLAMVSPYRNLKVFTVQKLADQDLQPWLAYKEKRGMTPTFYGDASPS